jgi:ribonuclease D
MRSSPSTVAACTSPSVWTSSGSSAIQPSSSSASGTTASF